MAARVKKKVSAVEQQWPADKVERWNISKLTPYANNPRTHPADQIQQIKASIKEWGWTIPILVDEKGSIIAGHGRVTAAEELGFTEVPVMVARGWTDAQKRAYVIADNQIPQNAGWDTKLLRLELGELAKLDYALNLTGFDNVRLATFGVGPSAPQADPDDAPEPEAVAVSKAGDIWMMGEHRLLCGDATSIKDVSRLMSGKRAGLMNTDPPYGVGYANDERPNPGVAKPRVANDVLADSALQSFLEAAFRAAKDHALKPNAAWYMWHAHLTQGFFAAAAAAAAAVILHRQIIWVKPVLLLGRGQYHWKHEPCFMGWVEGKQPPDYGLGSGERTQTTVWEINGVTQAERREYNHATPKPVALFDIPIRKHLLADEICYEPFAGSGPQFIAAEISGRICYGIDINPICVDVAVRRWCKFAGKKAVLQGTKKTFGQIEKERAKAAA